MVMHPSLMARVPLRPDPHDIDPLWAYYVRERDTGVRDKLLHAYLGFARMLAAKMFARRLYTEIEFDDYMQYATVGLLEALERFDPAHSVRFETFATSRINGAMLSGIETSSEIQQQIVARKRIVASRVTSLMADGEAAPPDDVFARLAHIAIGLAVGFALEGSGMHQEAQAQVPDSGYTGLALRQLRARVKSAVQDLSEQQRQVIESHYLQDHAFEEVARAMGVTRGRISQLHQKALAALRVALQKTDEVDVSF